MIDPDDLYGEPETTEDREKREAYEERVTEAKDVLASAIKMFVTIAYEDEPTAYVADWALVTHVLTAEMEQENASASFLTVPDGQPLLMTTGLITRAGHILSRT